jgi:hypothetical protein
MKIQRRLISSLICALALLSNAAGVGTAQEKSPRPQHDVVFEHHVIADGTAAGQDDHMRVPFEMMVPPGKADTFMFISSEMSFDGKTVKGAPYSAQAITEHAQTLQDGNRIVQKSTASVFRDSEGRTRREQTINAVGAYTAGGTPKQTLFINDPVANVNYILDADSRTARKIDLSKLPARSGFAMGGGSGSGQRVEIVTTDTASGGASNVVIKQDGPGAEGGLKKKMDAFAKNMKSESLGKQTIEGVVADGTRHTHTIAAGEIGNEQPINIVSESWYSAELQTVVLSKHSDPRFGESSFRLVNINRSEPAASLFQVPSDYTVKEAMPPGMRLKVDSEMRRPKNDQ